jgi:hypothetical protein
MKRNLSILLAFLPLVLCAQVSSNKAFWLGTNNSLRPNETNFFAVNSNLLNASVAAGSGGGGGGGSFSGNASQLFTGGGTTSIIGGAALTNISAQGISNASYQIVVGSQTNSNTFRVYQGNFADLMDWYGTGGAAATLDHLANFTTLGNVVAASFSDGRGFSTDGLGDVTASNLAANASITAATNITAGGQFNGNGGGLTNLPASQLTGPLSALVISNVPLTNVPTENVSNLSVLNGPATIYQALQFTNPSLVLSNQWNTNGVATWLGTNSGALVIRGSVSNTNTLVIQNGSNASRIFQLDAVTASATNGSIAWWDTNGSSVQNGTNKASVFSGNGILVTNVAPTNIAAQGANNGQAMLYSANAAVPGWYPSNVSGSGTVTSVALAADSAGVIASISGSPITVSGAMTPTFASIIGALAGLANGAGCLSNNGSGTLSWQPVGGGSGGGGGGSGIALNNAYGTNTSLYDPYFTNATFEGSSGTNFSFGPAGGSNNYPGIATINLGTNSVVNASNVNLTGTLTLSGASATNTINSSNSALMFTAPSANYSFTTVSNTPANTTSNCSGHCIFGPFTTATSSSTLFVTNQWPWQTNTTVSNIQVVVYNYVDVESSVNGTVLGCCVAGEFVFTNTTYSTSGGAVITIPTGSGANHATGDTLVVGATGWSLSRVPGSSVTTRISGAFDWIAQ